MSMKKQIQQDRAKNKHGTVGDWLPKRSDVEALGMECAIDAYKDGPEGHKISSPSEKYWRELEDAAGKAGEFPEVQDAFADAWRRTMRKLIG